MARKGVDEGEIPRICTISLTVSSKIHGEYYSTFRSVQLFFEDRKRCHKSYTVLHQTFKINCRVHF